MAADAVAHVWVRSIAAARPRREQLAASLAAAERAHMARYYFEADAMRFLVGRATLRAAAAAWMGVAPADLSLEAGEFGKLTIAGGPHANVSHSGDIVIVALCASAEIGVDVEQIVAAHAAGIELRSFFSPTEIEAHLACPPDLRASSFFHLWTTKEALIKAAATGLSLSLQSFDVSADPRRPPALLAARCPELTRDVCVAAIDVPPGYAAVLAAFAPACRIEYRD